MAVHINIYMSYSRCLFYFIFIDKVDVYGIFDTVDIFEIFDKIGCVLVLNKPSPAKVVIYFISSFLL